MKTANSKIKTKTVSSKKAQAIPKKTKVIPKTANSSVKRASGATPSKKQVVQKPARKKTILLNPLARSGKTWNSAAPASQSLIEDLPAEKPPKLMDSAVSTKGKVRKVAPERLPVRVSPDKPSVAQVGINYGSIEYFALNRWKNVKIINKNNELGIYDGANTFYPLSSFKVEKSSKADNGSAKRGLSEALIRGVIGFVATGLTSLRPASISGYLFNFEADTKLSIKFDKKGIKAMEMAKVDVK